MNHTILKALKRKGFSMKVGKPTFILDCQSQHDSSGFFSQKMSGHIKLTFRYCGRDTSIRTWVSHGKKEISDRLLGIMAEQLSLSRQQFDDLVDCSLGERDLIALYEEKGIL